MLLLIAHREDFLWGSPFLLPFVIFYVIKRDCNSKISKEFSEQIMYLVNINSTITTAMFPWSIMNEYPKWSLCRLSMNMKLLNIKISSKFYCLTKAFQIIFLWSNLPLEWLKSMRNDWNEVLIFRSCDKQVYVDWLCRRRCV